MRDHDLASEEFLIPGLVGGQILNTRVVRWTCSRCGFQLLCDPGEHGDGKDGVPEFDRDCDAFVVRSVTDS